MMAAFGWIRLKGGRGCGMTLCVRSEWGGGGAWYEGGGEERRVRGGSDPEES